MLQAAELVPALAAGTALFEHLYRPMTSGRWELHAPANVLTRGYWSPPGLHTVSALTRDGETWMSLTPLEFESQGIGVALASSHVAVLGLGMGWSAAASALREGVTAVTVVERDPDVIAMHRELDLFARLPGGAGDKLRIVSGDAFDWRPDAPVDLLMPDIWLPLVSDGRVVEVQRMQANAGAKLVYFWGQEMEIARHARAAGRALDAEGIRATVADFGLPLIGPELPGYSECVAAAAEAWMRDRWLPAETAA
ncbi:hypothetical protein [Sphingomonas sp. MS122]|uniref:hypothetical protein n=1 Tax=Sphingomonas sp. MS122 TaxID=3412683 RepID=UPI003C2D5A35